MTVRTAQTAKTSHRRGASALHGADTESKTISCREAARENGFTEVPIWGTPVTLNVAGIKLIRAKTKE